MLEPGRRALDGYKLKSLSLFARGTRIDVRMILPKGLERLDGKRVANNVAELFPGGLFVLLLIAR